MAKFLTIIDSEYLGALFVVFTEKYRQRLLRLLDGSAGLDRHKEVERL